jgi:signal transduction histidine kinase
VFLDIIVEEADRLNCVVTEFLEYARPSGRKPRPLSLREPVEKAMSRLLRERPEAMKKVRRHVLVHEPDPQVNADPAGDRAVSTISLRTPSRRCPTRRPRRPREFRRRVRTDRRR